MSHTGLRATSLEWDAIQRSRMALNGMLRAFERQGRTLPPWLDNPDGEPNGMLQMLEQQEHAALRAVTRATGGEEWTERVAAFVAETLGLGPAVLCIVGLLPPLPNFANPAKLWKYLGLHVLTDHQSGDTHLAPVGGRAPKRPTCGPICKKPDCIHDRWSFTLKSYAIARVVPSIVKCLASPYRAVYDGRKAHTAVTHPEWATANPKAPKLHYERDAQRYVAKRVWRDVWRAAHGQTFSDIQITSAEPLARQSDFIGSQ